MTKGGLRVAIAGTRGIPARYGGFETFAEQLSTRLAARGACVTVYGRSYRGESCAATEDYRGVRLVRLRAVRQKYLETPLHALLSFFHLIRNRVDVVLLCNAANAPFAWLPRLFGMPVAVCVDGIERERLKWGLLGRLWYRLGEWSAVRLTDAVIADAEVIASYYRTAYSIEPFVITYGANPVFRPPGETLRRHGLQPGNYILYVSRLEPENHALTVIRAHALTETNVPLVIVGDAPYASAYKAQLRAEARPNVIFTGFQFGEAYEEFRSHALCYVQATEVGGTHPALVEALAYGNPTIANDTPENREVLGDAGYYYDRNSPEDLAVKLRALLSSESERGRLSERGTERAAQHYVWDRVVERYEELFKRLVR